MLIRTDSRAERTRGEWPVYIRMLEGHESLRDQIVKRTGFFWYPSFAMFKKYGVKIEPSTTERLVDRDLRIVREESLLLILPEVSYTPANR